MTSLLHRHRRDARQRLSGLMRKIRQVANYLDFRAPGNRKVVVHNEATGTARWHGQSIPNERRVVAVGPKLHAARHELVADLQATLSEFCIQRHCTQCRAVDGEW